MQALATSFFEYLNAATCSSFGYHVSLNVYNISPFSLFFFLLFSSFDFSLFSLFGMASSKIFVIFNKKRPFALKRRIIQNKTRNKCKKSPDLVDHGSHTLNKFDLKKNFL